jgi:demethylmenaquinone methyltransferase/2-methoxy-6-polyprenyl-1,4-benzoquinol methylase
VSAPPAVGGLPTGEEKTRRVREIFDAIAPRYELVNHLITLGLDGRWRTRCVEALALPAGSVILDVAAGTGDLCVVAARLGLRPIAADLSGGMLAERRTPAPAVQCDVAALPLADASVDGVVCGFALRNFTDLADAFSELARVVRPGGRVSLLEVGAPERRLTRAGFGLWFNRVVPVIGGALSDSAAYRYLPASVAYLPDVAALRAALVAAGFSGVNRHLLSGGLSQLYTATRSGQT